MPDEPCVKFLQWALPRLGLRWEGFRRVRRQVCRRLRRRLDELGLADLAAYREYLDGHPEAPGPQHEVLARLADVLRTDGALVIGLHESLPEPAPGFAPWPGARAIFRRRP